MATKSSSPRVRKARTSAAKAATKSTKRAAETAAAKKRAAAKSAEAEEKRNAEREAKAAQAEKDRQAAIKAGDLFEGDDGTEFYRSDEKEEMPVVMGKANDIIEALKASDVPVRKRDIAEPNIMSVGIFSTLKVLGYVEEFRARGGQGAGVAYLWTGKK